MWSQLALVTDTELGQLEPEAVATAAPWGATTWASARTEAKRDLKIWLERDFANQARLNDPTRQNRISLALPAITDRILDRWNPDWVFTYISGGYRDTTTAARDDNEDDLDLAAALATVGTDRIYVGALYEFEGLAIKLLSTLNAIASVMTVKYWGPKGWTSIGATDGTIGTSGKTLSQTGRVTWTLPADWERKRLNGTAEEFYWVEISVSVALTGGTVATQILPIHAPDGLKRVAAYLALGRIFQGLAAQAANPDAWMGRVTNQQRSGYRDMAEDLYAQLRDGGGIPIDLNLNETIDSQERAVTEPLRMRRG